jgi:hypothetical protein
VRAFQYPANEGKKDRPRHGRNLNYHLTVRVEVASELEVTTDEAPERSPVMVVGQGLDARLAACGSHQLFHPASVVASQRSDGEVSALFGKLKQ